MQHFSLIDDKYLKKASRSVFLKIVAENYEKINASEKPLLARIVALAQNGLTAKEKADYAEADKYLAQALAAWDELCQLDQAMHQELFSGSFYKISQTFARLRYLTAVNAIAIAEQLQDNHKIIEYCSVALDTLRQGAAISVDIYLKRGEAYWAIGEKEKALADYNEYHKHQAFYGAVGAQIACQEQIAELLLLLFDYYQLYIWDTQISQTIWQGMQELARLWEILE